MADSVKITAEQFDEQIAALKEVAAMSVDACLIAKLIAGSDQRVRDLFLKKIGQGHVFRGITCINRVGIPEYKYVLFDFECAPGVFCLVPPAFMVIVNFIDRHVVSIVDPYLSTTLTASAANPCGCQDKSTAPPNSVKLRSDCVDVTIENGKACLNIPYAGNVCVTVPNWVPNGTVAEACVDTCSKFGILCGAKVTVRALGQEVACNSWGCCDC